MKRDNSNIINKLDENQKFDKLIEACSILKDMRSVDKSHAREKIYNATIRKNQLRFRKILKVAAAILIPIVCSVATYFYTVSKSAEFVNDSMITIVAPQNGVMKYQLPDSSCVWLSKGSSISYAAGIAHKCVRNVKLSGEGYFQVKKSKSNPFIVQIGEVNVVVTGTEFNCIEKSNDIEITLVTGNITIENMCNRNSYHLRPNQQYIYYADRNEELINNVDCRLFTAWKDGEFYFKNSDLAFVIERLSRTLNVDIQVADKKDLKKRLTAHFKNESVEDIVYVLSKILDLDYEIKILNNKKIILLK